MDRLQRWIGLYQGLVKHRGGRQCRTALSVRHRVPPEHTLEHFALQFLLRHQCVTTVLVGARSRHYVKSALGAAGAGAGTACWPARNDARGAE